MCTKPKLFYLMPNNENVSLVYGSSFVQLVQYNVISVLQEHELFLKPCSGAIVLYNKAWIIVM